MSLRRSHAIYAAVRTEGGLLPPDLIDRVKTLDAELGGITPVDYGLLATSRLDTEIAQAWQAIQTHFASFRRTMEWVNRDKGQGTSETRTWVQQVLRELGYHQLQYIARAETIDDRSYLISHRAGDADNAPPVHIISFRQALDERASRTGGGEQRSPQALVQGYLNASDHLWGVVTNGLVFRLLRENRQIDRVLRVEFDLEGMLEAENFAEFRIFWLLLHRSRFVQAGERRETAWLERWTAAAASQGARALDGLRQGVETAIEKLGQGLLSHPDNAYLRQQLQAGTLTIDAYYSELLRLVYRLLFLMVAEERQLLFTTNADARSVARYHRHYSIERLRTEAARLRNREQHHDDLWRGLLVTFDAMRFPKEAAALGLEPLAGGLFGAGSCPHVADDAAPGTRGSDRIAGRPMLANAAMLDAVQALSEVTRAGITRRVNYRDLDVEELGSVYEGLLEHRPALEPLTNGHYKFGFSDSTSRKETGSYYTPRSLVQELLNSALDPVIENTVSTMRTTADKRKALLALNVCDPACGSGHFLLGAARRIGRRLAEVEAGEGNEPDLAEVRHGVRDAIRHCIYGVDKNPLAIDLCKTALWIESHEPGAPISFLDHHIKRGDSLVGVFDLDALQVGIPDGAYTPVTGDDKKIASDLKKRNTAEKPKQTMGLDGRATTSRAGSLWGEDELENLVASLAQRLDEIEAMPDSTIADVQKKEAAYHQLHGRDDWRDVNTACDFWTYAFFAPLTAATSRYVPTSATVRRMIGKGDVPADITARALAEANGVGFFHWKLQFPEVFRRGGFDAVLGNPPWERVKLQEKEFFADRDPAIANAGSKATRTKLIKQLTAINPALLTAFHGAMREAENSSLFMRTSGRNPLTGRGDVNLYSAFAEHFRNLIAPFGRAGVILPTGIATDDTNKFFFADIVNMASLAALYDFENRGEFFANVHRSYKFSLMTLAGSARQDRRFRAGFFLLDPMDIHEPDKTFLLSSDDIALLNPNTRTCPIFRSMRDAGINELIYKRVPVLKHESGKRDDWGVRFLRLFDITNDSGILRTSDQLLSEGASRQGEQFLLGGEKYFPVYEGKMVGMYDHRHASIKFNPENAFRGQQAVPSKMRQKEDVGFFTTPWQWGPESEGRKRTPDEWESEWFPVFKRVTASTNERTLVGCVVPWSTLSYTLYAITCAPENQTKVLCLAANLWSFVADYLVRQKTNQPSLTMGVLYETPVLSPAHYSDLTVVAEITDRVVELSYTSENLELFARDFDCQTQPYVWDEDRRARLRAELDGIYAHLYGISREDFAYILDTFPIVRRKDIAEHGEYRTKRLCLEAYDWFAPESLRELEGKVRDLEVGFRRAITIALGGEVDQLPSHLRDKMREEMAKYGRDPDGASLADLLSFSYFLDLEKLIRADVVWSQLGGRFESKRQFEIRFGAISKIRNPLAHARTVASDERREGEEALRWLQQRLGAGQEYTPAPTR